MSMTRREVLALLPALAAAQDDEPSFNRIDCHMHVHRVAPVLLSGMEKTQWRGLSICVSRAVDNQPNDVDEQLRGTPVVHRASKGRFAWAASFDPRQFESSDFAGRTIEGLQQHFKDGAIAVKIWKNIGMWIRSKSGQYLMPDSPALMPVYEAIQKADRTLVAHLAEPDGAWMPLNDKNPEIRFYSSNPEWHMYNKPGVPSKEEILSARDRIAARFPKLRIVGCHLGSNEEDLARLAKRLDAHANFAVDLAARVRYLVAGDHKTSSEFLTRYQDRIVYGSDFRLREGDDEQAWKSVDSQHARDWQFLSRRGTVMYGTQETQGLGLPEAILRKIFNENPRRWYPGILPA
jgi:predicted TIM-barrel fold metal-dependent hydrolase